MLSSFVIKSPKQKNRHNKLFYSLLRLTLNQLSLHFFVSKIVKVVIPLGFEPKTHSLEGCCSNPTELRNQTYQIIGAVSTANRDLQMILPSLAAAKVLLFSEIAKYFCKYLAIYLISTQISHVNIVSTIA